MDYCEKRLQYRRFATRPVLVGDVGVGGKNPIRIQSMTTSPTHDVAATVEQIIRLKDTGCEIARVTVQGKKEARACEAIANTLAQKGIRIPLVADIHFYPPAAMEVADFVDKVRINPGNFADRRATFIVKEYTDESYAHELEHLREKFAPLVEKCKRLKRAIRIGTNHGSLSDRILNRYGDTPAGMVESAFEFVRIAREFDFHDMIFSMKASNPLVMIAAYRLLVKKQKEEGWDYPLHLGVTEAGEGEDGRVKSAIGMGALLLDGIGDTIRVSLTEDPWCEIDPCKRLVAFAARHAKESEAQPLPGEEFGRDVFTLKAREPQKAFFLHPNGTVLTRTASQDADGTLTANTFGTYPIYTATTWPKAAFMGTEPYVLRLSDESVYEWEQIFVRAPQLIVFSPTNQRVYRSRLLFSFLRKRGFEAIPVIFDFAYNDEIIDAAAEMGSLLADGLGDGVVVDGPSPSLGFAILQGARMRSVKTEFISCPGCGRTLFGLQEVAAQIREKTGHLAGVKIAIMGCIVNGPGEMADADFGYVGSKAGLIDLYVGKTCVERDIPMIEAPERLIALIKAHGRWVESQTEMFAGSSS